MGTGLVGADVEALNELQLSFRRHAGSLQSTMSSASGGIAALGPIWHGADSAQFRSAWRSIHRPALQSLSEAAANIQRNADAQDRTSAVDGPGVGVGAPGLIPYQSPGGQISGRLPGGDPASTRCPSTTCSPRTT